MAHPNEDLVREASEALGKRDYDTFLSFHHPDVVIHANGRTYAVSNQWGTNTELVIRRLATTFPAAGIVVDSFAE